MLWAGLKRWVTRGTRKTRGRSRAPGRPNQSRPRVECLEDRRLLTTLIGLTSGNNLITFDSAAPGTILRQTSVTGVQGPLLGIDFRPATGQLYGLTRESLYLIDFLSGAATRVSAAPLSPAPDGGQFGFGEVARAITISIINDSLGGEGKETFNLTLSNPAGGGGATLGADLVGVLTINDDRR